MTMPGFSNVLQVPELSRDECLFCRPKKREILDSNEWAMVLTDTYPVVEGHCLIVPRRHAAHIPRKSTVLKPVFRRYQ